MFFTVNDHSINVKRATAFALSCMNDNSTIPLIIKLLIDKNNDIKNLAVFALNFNMYNSKEIRDELLLLLSVRIEELRFEAIVGLAMRNDKRVSQILRDELGKDNVLSLIAAFLLYPYSKHRNWLCD